MKKNVFDAVVVGSGASGSIAVKELTEKGLNVLLLEAGPHMDKKDFPDNQKASQKIKGIDFFDRARITLSGQPIQARATYISKEYNHLFVNDLQNPYTTPKDQYYLWIRGRQLGGRLHTYGRVLLRMSDIDFKAADRDGYGENWPISYDDLAPYYDKVEEFLGVYGSQDGISNLPDGKYIKAPILTKPEAEFKQSVESESNAKVISWRFSTPNLERIPKGVIAAQDTGLLTLQTDAVVSRILIDPNTGKATGIEYINRTTKKAEQVHAKVVMLCASAIESVRILFNSACSAHPNGVGNANGLLGKYFLEQTPSLIAGRVPTHKGYETDNTVIQDPFCRPTGGVYIPRFENVTSDNGHFKRGFGYQGVVGRGFVPDDQPAQFGFMGFGEMLPYKRNNISINPKKKDAWGIPVAHIDCSFGPNELALIKAQTDWIKQMVLDKGYQIDFCGNALGLDPDSPVFPNESWLTRKIFKMSFAKSMGIGAAIHESGGARMGHDPSMSVLNEYNQVWDAPNIFVTDGSCFVTSGSVGPTLTMMAITARACDYIGKQFESGQL
ncbi:GMC family oxidoreductase [Vibrio albus]|uniref:GMC family oxidoreductase n=1 Tax=Vibrio albus TaxID=2200953 RepID=A0A2U3B9E2_9VIBR|nr:GMC family oxidoreductase [Vibrio albus]PWI33429.1 GMC family oxidoreductase [Vibrio albus]